MKEIDVVIPVFNSEASIKDLVGSLLDSEIRAQYGIKIILVNDGSVDQSLEICLKLAQSFPNITVIDLMQNYGQHAALFAGIANSNSEFILTMDDDGQHLPSTIPLLLSELREDIDVVYGVALAEEHSHLRNWSSKILKYGVFRLLNIENSQETSAFRLIRRRVFLEVNLKNMASGFLEVLIQWNTNRIKSIRVPMNKRLEGKSNYSFFKLAKMAFSMITSYSVRPLRLAVVFGLVSFLGLTFSILIFSLQLFPAKISCEFIAFLIFGFSTLELIALGILGEYLGKVHQMGIGKPLYQIRSITNSRPSA
jgi:undecaprenyl-phosphate 4-deoxy-4-formamido-L-arabinose transferase